VGKVLDPLLGAVAAVNVYAGVGIGDGFRGICGHESVYLV
jgi:hypothetical protein